MHFHWGGEGRRKGVGGRGRGWWQKGKREGREELREKKKWCPKSVRGWFLKKGNLWTKAEHKEESCRRAVKRNLGKRIDVCDQASYDLNEFL